MVLQITSHTLNIDNQTSISLPLLKITLGVTDVIIVGSDHQESRFNYLNITNPVVANNSDLYSWFQTNCTQ